MGPITENGLEVYYIYVYWMVDCSMLHKIRLMLNSKLEYILVYRYVDASVDKTLMMSNLKLKSYDSDSGSLDKLLRNFISEPFKIEGVFDNTYWIRDVEAARSSYSDLKALWLILAGDTIVIYTPYILSEDKIIEYSNFSNLLSWLEKIKDKLIYFISMKIHNNK